MTFQGTLGWLDKELAKLEEKAAKLRSARAVLAEYAPEEVVEGVTEGIVQDEVQCERDARAAGLAARLAKPRTAKTPAPVASPRRSGPHVQGKSANQAMFRCLHPVVEEYGSGGRGIAKTLPCGATVWDADRQKHLRVEHGLETGIFGSAFEQLKDPEEVADVDAA